MPAHTDTQPSPQTHGVLQHRPSLSRKSSKNMWFYIWTCILAAMPKAYHLQLIVVCQIIWSKQGYMLDRLETTLQTILPLYLYQWCPSIYNHGPWSSLQSSLLSFFLVWTADHRVEVLWSDKNSTDHNEVCSLQKSGLTRKWNEKIKIYWRAKTFTSKFKPLCLNTEKTRPSKMGV